MVNQSSIVYVTEAAELLGKSIRTIHRMAADGRLPVAARGRGIRGTLAFNRSDVEALKASESKSA